MPSLQHTDAYILIEFRDAVKHLMGKPLEPSDHPELKALGEPFLARLMANGNSRREACYLMMAVFEDKQNG
jgi:hypothetical protein